MRLFIAINFTTETKNKLLALRDRLRAASNQGNFSLPENLHLTLAFLGECTAKEADVTKSVMNSIELKPFDLMIDQIGCFKRNDGDIWWAGVQESKDLLDLQRDLVSSLTAAGFTMEKRKYSPHITLGRKVMTDTAPRQINPFGETITNIDLMKTERIGGKLTYTAIHRIP